MYHIKLTKGRSFSANIDGEGFISVTKENPDLYISDKDAADKLVDTGYFELVSEVSGDDSEDAEDDEDTGGNTQPPAYGGKTLDEMAIPELETFATYKGVNLKGIRKKPDIIKKLREELPAEELEGIIEYGSPTMVELQEN